MFNHIHLIAIEHLAFRHLKRDRELKAISKTYSQCPSYKRALDI